MDRRVIYDPEADAQARHQSGSSLVIQDVDADDEPPSFLPQLQEEMEETARRLEVLEELSSEVSEIGVEFRRLAEDSAEGFASLPD